MGRILAIDPGDKQSGYVIVEHDGNEITCVIDKGKVTNEDMMAIMSSCGNYDFAIEMIQSYGMPVGASVFDTCVWIGRFIEHGLSGRLRPHRYIYREEERLTICRSPKAKDANIIQALIDRFAPNTGNKGKGTKAKPGFFYGFKGDIWQAMGVAVTYFDIYIKGHK